MLSSYLNLVLCSTKGRNEKGGPDFNLIGIVKQGYKIANQVLGEEEFKAKFKNVLKSLIENNLLKTRNRSSEEFNKDRRLNKNSSDFSAPKRQEVNSYYSGAKERPLWKVFEKQKFKSNKTDINMNEIEKGRNKISGFGPKKSPIVSRGSPFQSFKIRRRNGNSIVQEIPTMGTGQEEDLALRRKQERSARLRSSRTKIEIDSGTEGSITEQKESNFRLKSTPKKTMTSSKLTSSIIVREKPPASVSPPMGISKDVKNHDKNMISLNEVPSSEKTVPLTFQTPAIPEKPDFKTKNQSENVLLDRWKPDPGVSVLDLKPTKNEINEVGSKRNYSSSKKESVLDFESSCIEHNPENKQMIIGDLAVKYPHSSVNYDSFKRSLDSGKIIIPNVQMDQESSKDEDHKKVESSEKITKNRVLHTCNTFTDFANKALNNSKKLLRNNTLDLKISNDVAPKEITGSSPINLPTRQQHSITAKKTSEIERMPDTTPPSQRGSLDSFQSRPHANKNSETVGRSSIKQTIILPQETGSPNFLLMSGKSRREYYKSQYRILVNNAEPINKIRTDVERLLSPPLNFADESVMMMDQPSRIEMDEGVSMMVDDQILQQEDEDIQELVQRKEQVAPKLLIPYELDELDGSMAQIQKGELLESNKLYQIIGQLTEQNKELMNKLAILNKTNTTSNNSILASPKIAFPITRTFNPNNQNLSAILSSIDTPVSSGLRSASSAKKLSKTLSVFPKPNEQPESREKKEEQMEEKELPSFYMPKEEKFNSTPPRFGNRKTVTQTVSTHFDNTTTPKTQPELRNTQKPHGSYPIRNDLRYNSCLVIPYIGKQDDDKTLKGSQDVSFVGGGVKKKKSADPSQSVLVDPSPDQSVIRKVSRANSISLNKNKMKENFKGESVTVVRTHTIESFNGRLTSYIRVSRTVDKKDFKFELSAYLNEAGEGDTGSSHIQKMNIDTLVIAERDFFEILCRCKQSHINLCPNFLLINENIDFLLRYLVVRYLDLVIDYKSSTIRPIITEKPLSVLQIPQIDYMNAKVACEVIHNKKNNFWVVLSGGVSQR